MATRRTTRRTATNPPDAENLLTATSTLISGAAATGASKIVKGKGLALVTKSSTSMSTSASSTAVPRKRVLGDVTNAAKNKSSFLVAGGSKSNTATAFSKPIAAAKGSAALAAASTDAASRRTVRTRSSTGGSEAKLEGEDDDEALRAVHDNSSDPNGNGDNVEEEEEVDENAMVLDEPITRPIKAIRNSARPAAVIPSRGASTSAMVKADIDAATRTAITATTKTRVPLGAKTSNRASTTTTSTATARLAATKKKVGREATTASAVARTRRIEAAQAELEAAIADDQHAPKRTKTTSEVDLEDGDDDAEELIANAEEEVEEAASKVRRMDAHVNGRGMKDEGWIDLDDGDEDDPLMVASYVVEVYEYMRELELTTMPDTDYMARQSEVTWKMRGILIDWLVEIHTKFRLLPETIFLATNIIDRFLSTRVVSLVKFQLVGVTALFIASKYEEVVCPSISNFLYMTDGGYEDDEILKAERYVLAMIDFNLSYPNPINFLRRISKADGYDITSRTLAKYLMEISIVDHKFLGCPPSLIAAAGSWLARKVLGKGAWDPNLIHYSGYTEAELLPTAQLMLDYVVRSSSLDPAPDSLENPLRTEVDTDEIEHPNFTKKYAAKKFYRASTLMRNWAENEYGPIESEDPITLAFVSQFVPAVL